jgi:outer membrane receptor protein involved in Fe transport
VSNGRTRHRGVEFALSYALSSQWTVLADGTYAVHTYAFSAALAQGNTITYGDDMKYAPRTLGSLRLRWTPAAETQVEAAYQHVGGYWLDESNSHRYGGHDLVNLYLSQGFGRGWNVAFRIINAANVAYAERADYSFGNYRYFPGDGREYFAELQKAW